MSLRFGLIADVHQDVMPDGVERITAFAEAMAKEQPDFVLQLGDFCVPAEKNRAFLEAWNGIKAPRHHVLGNHDMDGGHTREQALAFFAMPGRYHSFDSGPVRAIVLDGNDPGGKAKGYKRFVAADQLIWLEKELAANPKPALVFIHQPVDSDHDGCVENSAAVRAVLERAEKNKPGTVLAVFSGHLHLDYAKEVNGIRYFLINSASYWWLNEPTAARETFPPETHRKFPHLKSVAAYRDPLWALVTLDLERGELSVEGRASEWVGPDPLTRGEKSQWSKEQLHPAINPQRIKLVPPAG
jgi:3',5'-cyclic AMP phosphodiesterase CpdA